MRSEEMLERYQRACNGLSAAPWTGWASDWRAFQALGAEPIDDLIVSRGDRDELSINASRSLSPLR